MNKYDELVELIESKKQQLLQTEETQNNERLEYLTSFFEKYNVFANRTLESIKSNDILLTYLLVDYQNIAFEELKQQVEEIEPVISSMNFRYLYVLSKMPADITEERIQELQKEKDKFLTRLKLFKLYIGYAIKCAKNKIDIDKMDFKVQHVEDLLLFFKMLQLIRKVINENSIKNFESLYENAKSKKDFSTKLISSTFERSYNYCESLKKEISVEKKNKKIKLSRYNKLLEHIKQMDKKEEITQIDFILDMIEDEDVKMAYLKYVNEHNQLYYQKLEKEYCDKNENSLSQYISYFQTIGINFLQLPKETRESLLAIRFNELKNRMNSLLKLSINMNDLITISIQSDSKIIVTIDKLLKNGYIDSNTLMGNLTIYYDRQKLDNFEKNLETILSEKINITCLENKQFMLTDNKLLTYNLQFLRNLLFSTTLTQIKDFSMLSEENLIEKTASFIEVGLENEIKTNPDILNADANLPKRIIISKIVGEDIVDTNGIKTSILEKDNFFIPDNKINQYLLDRNNSNYNNKGTIDLSNCKENRLNYLVGGIIIPKTRVSRLCISLETIIKPSLYSQEEVKVLEKLKK